jgi:FG-GAP repeat
MRRVMLAATVVVATFLAAAWPATAGRDLAPARTGAVVAQELRADFNGDDLDDLAVGVPGEDLGVHADAGAVNVQYGSAGGLAGDGQVLTQGTPEDGDRFGSALAKGFFNDDDFVDLAVGAPAEDIGRTDAAGVVVVFYGSAGGLTGPGDILQQTNPENGDGFGSALDSGDVQGDGIDDLAVGAPGEDVGSAGDAGAVTLFLGFPGGLGSAPPIQNLFQGSPENGDRFGAALEAAPFGGDPGFDLAVGAPGETVALAGAAGAVTVFYSDGEGLGVVGQTLLQGNPEVGDLFGFALVSGSFRHNGHFDLAVGVPGEDIGASPDIGSVALFAGQAGGLSGINPRNLFQRQGGVGGREETGDQFGWSLAAGLYNGDDFYDLAVGAPGEDIGTVRDAGAVNTLHGSAVGLAGTGQVLFQGDGGLGDAAEPNDRFGQALAKGRFSNNFNDDAFDDLAVGVAFEDVGDRFDAGLVNLLDGSAADGLLGSGTVLFQGADLGGGARVGGTAEAGDVFGGSVE